jgi:hypothetical protein
MANLQSAICNFPSAISQFLLIFAQPKQADLFIVRPAVPPYGGKNRTNKRLEVFLPPLPAFMIHG